MKVQCSILGSSLGTIDGKQPGLSPQLTESPLHALQGNQDLPTFYGITVIAQCPNPSLVVYSCNGPSGDDITDALAYYNFTTSHDWTLTVQDNGFSYTQHDEIDAATFLPTVANVVSDSFPGGFNAGQDPLWNYGLGYLLSSVASAEGSTFSSAAGAVIDKTPFQNAMLAALNGLDWSAIWAGASTATSFIYDCSAVDPMYQQRLPIQANGVALNDFPPSGNLVTFTNPFFLGFGLKNLGSPSYSFTPGNAGGMLALDSTVDGSGLFFSFAQVKITGFLDTTSPLEYFFIEMVSTILGVSVLGISTQKNPAATQPKIQQTYYRQVGGGLWTKDNQIVQLPAPSPQVPRVIGTPDGQRVVSGSTIRMVVGQSFSEWMQNSFGANWQNLVLSS